MKRARHRLCAAACSPVRVLAAGQQQLPRAAQAVWRQRHRRVRRLVRQQRRQPGFLVGYYNRNSQQSSTCRSGPTTASSPAVPTWASRRTSCRAGSTACSSCRCRRTFGPDDRLTWTIVANGQSTTIPLRLHPDYVIEPVHRDCRRQHAAGRPVRGERRGHQGPDRAGRRGCRADGVAGVAAGVDALGDRRHEVHERHERADVAGRGLRSSLTWSKYRGPGEVDVREGEAGGRRSCLKPATAPFSGKATTNVKFSEPGEYVLHVTANDYSGEGGGGFVCCWTTAMLKVSVSPR